MYRVVYEKRVAVNDDVVKRRSIEVVPAHELNLSASTLRGSVITILHAHKLKLTLPKENVNVRRYTKPQYEELRKQLYKHFRRSKSRLFVRLLIDDFITDLEWNDLCTQAGFKERPFADLWYKFKHKFVRELWWSPNTKNMMPRLETQGWLAGRIGNTVPSRTTLLEVTQSH